MKRCINLTALLFCSVFIACAEKTESTTETEATCEDNCLSERNTCRDGEGDDAECTTALNTCLSVCDAASESDANAMSGNGGTTVDAGAMSGTDGQADTDAMSGAGGEAGMGGAAGAGGAGGDAGAEEEEFERYNGKWITVEHRERTG